MHADRLLLLADFLDTVPRHRFNYDRWIGPDWKGKPDLSCGTTACALGWATAMPSFRELGLGMDEGGYVTVHGESPDRDYMDSGNILAAQIFFDLTLVDARFLFMPSYNRSDNWAVSPPMAASPYRVATHIRSFVEWKQNKQKPIDSQ